MLRVLAPLHHRPDDLAEPRVAPHGREALAEGAAGRRAGGLLGVWSVGERRESAE